MDRPIESKKIKKMKKIEEHSYNRRNWLQLMVWANAGILLPTPLLSCTDRKSIRAKKAKINTILVISGWQEVNIGDIAHTPGLLHVLETFFSDTEIILWKKRSFPC